MTHLFPLAAAGLALAATFAYDITPGGPDFPSFLAEADEVVAARVITAVSPPAGGEGPMEAEAVVTGAAKGALAAGERVRFTESLWCGPTIHPGEERILFLRIPSRDGGFWSLCPISGKLDCFLLPADAPALSLEGVGEFLALTQAARAAPPRLTVLSLRKDRGGVRAEVELANGGPGMITFAPSRLRPMAELRGVRFAGSAALAGEDRWGWVTLDQGGTTRGTLLFPDLPAAPGDRLTLAVANESVLYPLRCWTGMVVSTGLTLSP